MHPKEGWRDGRPPIPGVTRPRPAQAARAGRSRDGASRDGASRDGASRDGASRDGVSRRNFLRSGAGAGAALLGAGGVGGLLSACSDALATGPVGKPLPLPRPDDPVTWPVYADNPAIADGLRPRRTPP